MIAPAMRTPSPSGTSPASRRPRLPPSRSPRSSAAAAANDIEKNPNRRPRRGPARRRPRRSAHANRRTPRRSRSGPPHARRRSRAEDQRRGDGGADVPVRDLSPEGAEVRRVRAAERSVAARRAMPIRRTHAATYCGAAAGAWRPRRQNRARALRPTRARGSRRASARKRRAPTTSASDPRPSGTAFAASTRVMWAAVHGSAPPPEHGSTGLAGGRREALGLGDCST